MMFRLLVSSVFALGVTTTAAHGGDATDTTSAAGSYDRFPVAFEENVGQATEAAHYVLRGRRYALAVTSDAIVMTLKGARGDASARPAELRIQFAGARRNPSAFARDELPGKVNYYLGGDRAQWHTGIRTYGRVGLTGLYEGIDLELHAASAELEYDFVVAPGADPRVIHMVISGAERLELNDAGDLLAHVGGRTVTQRAPIAYQLRDGVRVGVRCRFDLGEDRTLRFELGDYDPTQPLVIDPVVDYATLIGGAGDEFAVIQQALAVDAIGNTYVAVHSDDPSGFPTTGEVPAGSDGNALVVKFDADGSTLLYSTLIGGSVADPAFGFADEDPRSLAVDADGNAYLVGWTVSTDYPTTLGAFSETQAGGGDAILSKFDSTGALVYSTVMGGDAVDLIEGIAIGSDGAVYVTGTARDGFPTTTGAFSTTNEGGLDVFVSKLNLAGNGADDLLYSTFLGGPHSDRARAIAVDAAGVVYITGESTVFKSKGKITGPLPLTSDAFKSDIQMGKGAGKVIFVSKLSLGGNGSDDLLYSTLVANPSVNPLAFAIAVDDQEHVFVTGSMDSSDLPTTPGAHDTKVAGPSDAFVLVLDTTAAGDAGLVYGSYLGGDGADRGTAIAVDSTGLIYVAGHTSGSGFPTTADALNDVAAGNDGFCVQLDPAGNGSDDLLFSTLVGDADDDFVTGMAVVEGTDIEIYLAGSTTSVGFPTTAGAYDETHNGGRDVFVMKFTLAPPPPPTFGTVSGTVTDASDTTAIAGALVELDTGESDLTAADGSYSIPNAPTGSRLVTASATDFDARSQSVTVLESATATADFALDPATAGSVACITYDTSGGRDGDKHLHITVSIVDGSGNPVSGSSVSVDVNLDGPSFGSFSGTTDSNGEVSTTFSNAPGGVYSCDVTSLTGVTGDPAEPVNSHDKGVDAVPDADGDCTP